MFNVGGYMKTHVCFALLSVITIVASAPAQAQNGTLTRSFVSSSGVDTNPCTITQPCASFAHAYTAIGANGIIAALDPGKYGPLTITTPVTVNGNGWAAITGTAQGNGIIVNISGGLGNVILTGLEIDGAGAGYNGIVFEAGGSLTISNCIVKDFVLGTGIEGTGNGIRIGPTTGTIDFTIVNTIVVNNQLAGIAYLPTSGSATATGAIDHVFAANNNSDGIVVSLFLASGGSAVVSISNSVASNNAVNGIGAVAGSGTVTETIDNDQMSNNQYGLENLSATVVLSRSVITKNSEYGVDNTGTVETLQDNRIYANGNGNAVENTALTPVTSQ
jgi:hypothetical protein